MRNVGLSAVPHGQQAIVGRRERHAVDIDPCRRPTVPARVAPWRRPTAARLLPAAAAISCPSGEKRALKHQTPETFQRPDCRTGVFQVPDSGRLVGAGTDEPLAIDRKLDGVDRPSMALERQQRRALRGQLLSVRPDLDRPFGIRRGQLRAVAGEGDRRDGRRVSGRDAARSGGLWRCRKLTTIRPGDSRQRSVGHPDSTRRHSTFHRYQTSFASGVTVRVVASRRKIEN